MTIAGSSLLLAFLAGLALGVARRSHIPDILRPRALIAGRLARLGATRHFHHELLAFDERQNHPQYPLEDVFVGQV